MLLYKDRILYGKVETAIPTVQQEGLFHKDLLFSTVAIIWPYV